MKLTNSKLSRVIPPKSIWEVVDSSKQINSLPDWLDDDKGMEFELGFSDSELSILSSPSTKSWGDSEPLVAVATVHKSAIWKHKKKDYFFNIKIQAFMRNNESCGFSIHWFFVPYWSFKY